MPCGKYKNTQSRMIAAELEEKIHCGYFSGGGRFLTREEITKQYGISPVTAFRVLKILESDGLIACGRGHRALLLSGHCPVEKVIPPHRKKIILFAETEGSGAPDIELEWVVNYLFNRMRNDDLSIQIIREKPCALPEADGYLLLLEQEEAPLLYNFLRSSGKPFCMLSRSRLRENTLLVMPYLCLSQMVLNFAADHVRKIHVIRGGSSPFDRIFTLSADVILPVDSEIQICGYDRFSPSREEDCLRLMNMIESLDENEAFFCTNHILANHLQNEMKQKKKRNVSMAWSVGLIERTASNAGSISYPVIDLKMQEMAQSLLVMLYRQFYSGITHDPGMLIQPELKNEI